MEPVPRPNAAHIAPGSAIPGSQPPHLTSGISTPSLLYFRAIPAHSRLFRPENPPPSAPASPHTPPTSSRQRLAGAQAYRAGDQPEPHSQDVAFGDILLAISTSVPKPATSHPARPSSPNSRLPAFLPFRVVRVFHGLSVSLRSSSPTLARQSFRHQSPSISGLNWPKLAQNFPPYQPTHSLRTLARPHAHH